MIKIGSRRAEGALTHLLSFDDRTLDVPRRDNLVSDRLSSAGSSLIGLGAGGALGALTGSRDRRGGQRVEGAGWAQEYPVSAGPVCSCIRVGCSHWDRGRGAVRAGVSTRDPLWDSELEAREGRGDRLLRAVALALAVRERERCSFIGYQSQLPSPK